MRRKLTCGLTALALLTGCSASPAAGPESPPATSSTPQTQRAPVVMFLGDSYTAGTGKVSPERTYAGDLARKLGWQAIIGGWPGTGFLARGRVGKDFTRLFADQLAWRPAPDLVIVAGGHNDANRKHPLNGLNDAVWQLVNGIKERWPGVPLVLVGPMWGGTPTKPALAVRDVMRTVAGQLQVPFVDPLAEKWITGDVSRGTGNADLYIRRDEVHPNETGNAYFADKMLAALTRLGMDKPAAG
ncbi:SGNH/GDSL hydrolase family protein [Actinocorallia populi]|uniref:SGNH/GDSL hydrolase family protein n=1 Tax=Actinocorallia populi TaxID=2079200 RepID=UPI000D08CA19|nr:SGNH/GDSL hydrolase family protein [Actinocorallia populi]